MLVVANVAASPLLSKLDFHTSSDLFLRYKNTGDRRVYSPNDTAIVTWFHATCVSLHFGKMLSCQGEWIMTLLNNLILPNQTMKENRNRLKKKQTKGPLYEGMQISLVWSKKAGSGAVQPLPDLTVLLIQWSSRSPVQNQRGRQLAAFWPFSSSGSRKGNTITNREERVKR